MSTTDAIWNRAALEDGGSSPRAGDTALAALLRLHSKAMSSGLFDAVTNGLSADEIAAALAGYSYFALDEVASLVEFVGSQADTASEDELEALEAAADRRYAELVPQDATLVRAFKFKVTQVPDDFAHVVYPNFAKMTEYIAPNGVRWHRRGDGVLEGKRLARRLKKPEVRVVHHYLGELTEVPPELRAEFWSRAERRRAASGYTDFQGTEFKDETGHYLLVVHEFC